MKRWHGAVLALALLLCGCRSAYYSVWEKFGVQKRDLLKKQVVAARDEEKQAGEQFKDALTRLKELYAFQGGNLEKTYDALKADYDRSASKATDVRNRIKQVETVSGDLFTEWEKEITQISDASLRDKSRSQLQETRSRYTDMHAALKRAEQSMDPILTRFRDHVLYLKHNLNAQAVASLKGEAANIQDDISRLIAEMNASVAKADEFIKTLP
jgi:hypothetical protein